MSPVRGKETFIVVADLMDPVYISCAADDLSFNIANKMPIFNRYVEEVMESNNLLEATEELDKMIIEDPRLAVHLKFDVADCLVKILKESDNIFIQRSAARILSQAKFDICGTIIREKAIPILVDLMTCQYNCLAIPVVNTLTRLACVSSDYVSIILDEGAFKVALEIARFNDQGHTLLDNLAKFMAVVCRGSGANLDSLEKLEDGKIECHPLPLPPGSPTSPSTLPKLRTSSTIDHSQCQLSKWKKGKLLGRGTFGHVYLGFNSESGQMCAIKEVRVVTDDQTSKECLKQLNQEITLLSQLSQRNIVQYYGSELGEETLSVYLEYVSGGSIHKLLQEYGAFGEPVIQNYTRQILSGLAYLHGRNTLHRDIKGANILVDPNGEIKLADFGMAKHITNCTSMLSFKGSPYWMAPEVVMNSNGYNLAVDIWSLGCTILEMATSKPPWGQYEGVAAIFKIGNSKDIPEIPDHLSNDAKSFIRQCLQRDPTARPTASQLLDHPFVRDQATTRVANVNITKEAFPHTFDGSRTPTAQEMRSNRTNISSFDGDRATKSGFAPSRDLIIPRKNARTIISLPVSPTSSPLRQYGPAYQSCFISPPHPSFALVGQSSYNSSEFPARSNTKNLLDPWFEIPQYKSQTPPNRSPRRGPI